MKTLTDRIVIFRRTAPLILIKHFWSCFKWNRWKYALQKINALTCTDTQLGQLALYINDCVYTHVRTGRAYSGARCKFSCTCSPGGPWHSNSGVHELRWPPGGHALITHSLFDRHERLSSIFKCLLTSALRETSGRVLCFRYIMLYSYLINNYFSLAFEAF